MVNDVHMIYYIDFSMHFFTFHIYDIFKNTVEMLFVLIPFSVLQPHVYQVLITQIFCLCLHLNVILDEYSFISEEIILYLILVYLSMGNEIKFKLGLYLYSFLVRNLIILLRLKNTFYV